MISGLHPYRMWRAADSIGHVKGMGGFALPGPQAPHLLLMIIGQEATLWMVITTLATMDINTQQLIS